MTDSTKHPFTTRSTPEAMRDAITEGVTGHIVPSETRATLAAATRTIIDELMRTTAGDADLERAAALVSEAAAILDQRTHGRDYLGVAEGSLSSGKQSFIDYSPFIGVLNPLAPPIAISFDDKNVIGTCVYGLAYEGPPGCLHGGFIAAGFDEVLGFAQAFSGSPGMTGRLTISYRSPTPLFEEVRFVGRLDRVDGRKIYASATLHAGDRLCAEAEGLFITVRPTMFEELLKTRTENAASITSPD